MIRWMNWISSSRDCQYRVGFISHLFISVQKTHLLALMNVILLLTKRKWLRASPNGVRRKLILCRRRGRRRRGGGGGGGGAGGGFVWGGGGGNPPPPPPPNRNPPQRPPPPPYGAKYTCAGRPMRVGASGDALRYYTLLVSLIVTSLVALEVRHQNKLNSSC
jgi:hypothetical protein